MRLALSIACVCLVALAAWYIKWSVSMEPHIARVEHTIDAYNQRFKTNAYRATLKANAIYASGFPFRRTVVIDTPNIAMVWHNETYAIEAQYLKLHFEDVSQGRYSIGLPAEIQALYATPNAVPEAYKVSITTPPSLWLRVKDTPFTCKAAECLAPAEAIFKEVGIQPHGSMLLSATLNGRNEHISFALQPIPKPYFMALPDDPSRAISVSVSMLREALVFNQKYQ